jgi:hypothetical protein
MPAYKATEWEEKLTDADKEIIGRVEEVAGRKGRIIGV